MKQTELINELVTALATAQGEFPPIPKSSEVIVNDRSGKFLYKFKYADLTEIIDAIRPALAKNGIAFTQTLMKVDQLGLGFITTILHKSGQWMETGFIPAIVTNNMGMKDIAGITTYGKRLSLSQAFGVSADEDIDAPPTNGNSAAQSKSQPRNTQTAQKPPQQAQRTPPPNRAPQAAQPLVQASKTPAEAINRLADQVAAGKARKDPDHVHKWGIYPKDQSLEQCKARLMTGAWCNEMRPKAVPDDVEPLFPPPDYDADFNPDYEPQSF